VRDLPGGGVEQVEHAQTGTRLGEGLRDGGPLLPAAIDRTLEAVRDFTQRAEAHGAALASIATSAVRRADNAAEFGDRMRAVTGVPLQVLTGRAEAQCSFRGATYGTESSGARVAVLDVGGGSTECAVGRDGALEDALSIEIGSVRVSERRPALMGGAPGPAARAAAAEARAEIAERLQPFAAFAPVDEVRCVAGTPLTIGAIVAASHVDRVSGQTLSRASLDATIERLLDLPLAERRALPGMLPQRADVLAGGGLIVSEALRLLGADACRLEANDLLLGFLLESRPSLEAARGASNDARTG
jgi:exopolyphosphatase/guanosine-5'-triphosphate,3'-diphosphate pyrophosphatase